MFGIKGRVISKLQPDWLILVLKASAKSHREFPNSDFAADVQRKSPAPDRCLTGARLLTELADKFAVRSYVESRVGSRILPELYDVTTDPATIPFDELPENLSR